MLFLHVGGVLHVHDFSMIPTNFIVYNISYSDELYMCFDDPNRNGFVRYGWFSNDQTNSDCFWLQINKARKEWGASIINGMIAKSLQLTAEDLLLHKTKPVGGGNVDSIWRQFEGKITSLSDIVNYVPAFEECMYQAFEEFRKDNVQYMEVFKVFKIIHISHQKVFQLPFLF